MKTTQILPKNTQKKYSLRESCQTFGHKLYLLNLYIFDVNSTQHLGITLGIINYFVHFYYYYF